MNKKHIIKKVLAAAIIGSFFLAAAYAQNFGIKMYYNFSKNSWTLPDNIITFQENFSSKYAIGPFVELRLIPFFSFSAEGLLAKKGGIISPPAKKGIEYRLTYLSLPILINIYVVPVGPVQLFLSGGLEYSYLLSGKTYDLDLDVEVEDIKEKLFRRDTSYLLGGGIRLNLVVTSIILEGRYSIGQKSIFLPDYSKEGELFKNRVFSFGLGFTF
ncbi:MAG: porin family protein [Desulfonauticus sp.]|nr:porin family protein [Desulfonauticus sp.]